MAATKSLESTAFAYKVQTGLSGSGAPVNVTRTINGVNPVITDDDLYAVGNAIASLQQYPISARYRVDKSLITNA